MGKLSQGGHTRPPGPGPTSRGRTCTGTDESSIQAQTRLRFFLRRYQPAAATSEEFTGQVWHTWRLRREPPEDRWRVAAQIVDGFAQLNDNAATLFGAPAEGLRT